LVVHVVLALLHVLAEPSPLRPSSIPLDSLLLHLHFTMAPAPASRQSHSTPPYSFLFSVKRELKLILVISSHLVPFSAFLTSLDNNRAIVAMQ
jgi:pentatricopeptide repeat domain-containing protein 1